MKKTLKKTISWTIVSIFCSSLIYYLFFNNIAVCILVIFLERLFKTLLYFFHELSWENKKKILE